MKHICFFVSFLLFFALPANFLFAGDQKKDKKTTCVHNPQLFEYHLQMIVLPVIVEKVDWNPDTLIYTLSCVFYEHMSEFNYRVSEIEKDAQKGTDADRISWQKKHARHELQFFCYDKKAYDRLSKDKRQQMPMEYASFCEVEVNAIVRSPETHKKSTLVDKYLAVAQKLLKQFQEKLLPHPPTADDIAHAMGFVSSSDVQFKNIERSAEKAQLSVTRTEKKNLDFFLADFQNRFWYFTFCPFCRQIFSMHSTDSIDNLSYDSFMRVRQIPVQVSDLMLDSSDANESYLDISGIFANSGSREFRIVHFRVPLSLSSENFILTLRVKKGNTLSVLPSGSIRSYIIEHSRNEVWVMYVYIGDIKHPLDTARLIQLTHIDH